MVWGFWVLDPKLQATGNTLPPSVILSRAADRACSAVALRLLVPPRMGLNPQMHQDTLYTRRPESFAFRPSFAAWRPSSMHDGKPIEGQPIGAADKVMCGHA